jgi:hypothetical protein
LQMISHASLIRNKYALEVEVARRTVAALIAAGQFRAPRATKPKSQPNEPRKRKARGAVPVRKEATEEEQALVAKMRSSKTMALCGRSTAPGGQS